MSAKELGGVKKKKETDRPFGVWKDVPQRK
jgi:hypothetical protein